jgi:hypothetical protein
VRGRRRAPVQAAAADSAPEVRASSAAERLPSGWLPILVWALAVALSFAASKSFYLGYYTQLAVPLALLGGGLLHVWPSPGRWGERCDWAWGVVRYAPAVALVALVVLAAPRLQTQAQGVAGVLDSTKPAHADVGVYLKDNTPATTRVLVFEPNYAFLGSRELARTGDGQFFVDSHADMLYVNLGIKERGWADLVSAALRRQQQDEQSLAWELPAQDQVLAAFSHSDYVVIDHRARYLLSPETLKAIEDASLPVFTTSDVVLRQRVLQ